MAEPNAPATGSEAGSQNGSQDVSRRRHGVDPLALIVGLASIAVAVMALVGTVVPLPGLDPRWLLAAAAVAIGLMLLAASVRRRPNGRQ